MNRILVKLKNNDTVHKLFPGHVLFLLGIFVKQFYILPSGSLQIGDILLLCSFFYHIVIERRGRLLVHKDEYYLLAYFAFIIIINSIYCLVCHDIVFLKSIIYYLFNVLVLLVFVMFIQDKTFIFLEALRKTMQCGLVMQLLVFLGGFGRWYSRNRYEGTFNDPNQYGAFIFFSVLIIYISGCKLGKKNWVWVLLGFLLTLPSASAGMLVGYGTFFVSFLLINNYRMSRKKILLIGSCVAVGVFLLIGLWTGLIEIPEFIADMSIYQRTAEKLESFLDDSIIEPLVLDRGWEKIIDYPEYVLFGAGEGNYDRFGRNIEIHSSILGPIFYYGIFPFAVFLCWCGQKINGIEKKILCVYVALLAESFLLLNTRQPMFWMIIAMAGIGQLEKRDTAILSQVSDEALLPQKRINN